MGFQSKKISSQNKALFKAKKLDNKGRLTQYENVNGLISTNTYNLKGVDTDHLVTQTVDVLNANALVDKAYTYDALGNKFESEQIRRIYLPEEK